MGASDVFLDEIVEWNKLPQEFAGERVLFLQVVGGSEFLIKEALKKNAYQGCVLFDSDAAPLETMIVDASGIIAGYTSGEDGEAVRAVLNHQDASLLDEPERHTARQPPAGPGPTPYEVRIVPAQRRDMRLLDAGPADQYIAKNMPLTAIIMDVWRMPTARIVFPERMDDRNYDVSAYFPDAKEDLVLRYVRDTIQDQFGLSVEKQVRLERVFVLKASGASSSQLQPSGPNDRWMSGSSLESIGGTRQTMQEISRAFEELLRAPVIDETGMTAAYNYSASSKAQGQDAVMKMAHQLGLELTPDERPVEMLIVRDVRAGGMQ